MTTSRTPSRRHLLAAATVGLAPISLALWLTYPADKTGASEPVSKSEVRAEKSSTGIKSTPSNETLRGSNGS
jgi:hypothetical protein